MNTVINIGNHITRYLTSEELEPISEILRKAMDQLKEDEYLDSDELIKEVATSMGHKVRRVIHDNVRGALAVSVYKYR